MLSPISIPHTTKGFTTYYYKMCRFKMNMNCCRHQTLKKNRYKNVTFVNFYHHWTTYKHT